DGVVHRTVVIQGLHHLRDRRALLADGAVDTDQVAALAVDNGVERDRGLAGLAVANDELALATADGDHRVDGFQPSGHGLFHGLAVDNARSEALDRNVLVGVDRAFVINGLAERVDHSTDHRIAHRHAHDAAGALDLVAFFDFRVLTQEHHANLVFFQVHG